VIVFLDDEAFLKLINRNNAKKRATHAKHQKPKENPEGSFVSQSVSVPIGNIVYTISSGIG
jgi:hypothetical protein